MPSLLFIGHIFHVRTQSSAFFIKILAQAFDLKIISLDPARPLDVATLVSAAVDYVCLWQLDYLAPVFSWRGFRTIVVPMYDGSSTLSDEHWLGMKSCRLLNFSRFLHERVTLLGLDSIYVQYFPDPSGVKMISDFDTRRLFFWQRTPDTILNVETILRLFGEQVNHIHIHAAADVRTETVIRLPSDMPACSISTWFASSASYLAELEMSNIFVAPRLSEGIGHAFLEAMMRGMVVIAYALPTHTDYLRNWENGIAFDESCEAVDLGLGNDQLRQIGASARRFMEEGHLQWRLQSNELPKLLLSGTDSTIRKSRTSLDDQKLISAYQAGVLNYNEFIKAHL